jgi:hypothetical protein
LSADGHARAAANNPDNTVLSVPACTALINASNGVSHALSAPVGTSIRAFTFSVVSCGMADAVQMT